MRKAADKNFLFSEAPIFPVILISTLAKTCFAWYIIPEFPAINIEVFIMIYDRPLTDAERQKSQLNYNRFCLVNGASYMCLGESVVVLFAVRMGIQPIPGG